MKKIIFCDMDGTIIDERGLLCQNDRHMIREFREKGNIFVFNTGRNIEEATSAIKKYDLEYDYLVLNNGAHIIDKDNTVLYKEVILKETGIKIIKHCLKYPNLWVYYFDGQNTIAHYRGQTYKHSDAGMILCSSDNFLIKYQNVTEFDIIAIHQDDQQLKNVLEVQEYVNQNFRIEAQGTINQHYLDITPANCSKGTGLTNLAKLINEDLISYAIGDSYNDLSMFKDADYSYTFNHVTDEIKKYTDQQVDNLSMLIKEII